MTEKLEESLKGLKEIKEKISEAKIDKRHIDSVMRKQQKVLKSIVPDKSDDEIREYVKETLDFVQNFMPTQFKKKVKLPVTFLNVVLGSLYKAFT